MRKTYRMTKSCFILDAFVCEDNVKKYFNTYKIIFLVDKRNNFYASLY